MYLENRCSCAVFLMHDTEFFSKGPQREMQEASLFACVAVTVVCSIAENWHYFPRLFQL
jgi:hypothetical protein